MPNTSKATHRSIPCVLVATDALLVAICLTGAYYSRLSFGSALTLVPLDHGLSAYLSRWWIWIVIILSVAYRGGYGSIVTFWDEWIAILKGLTFSFLVVWLVLSLQKEAETVSRIVITLAFLYLAISLPLSRLGVKHVLFRWLGIRRTAYLYERRKGSRSDDLRDALNREWYSGYYIEGNVDRESLSEPIDACFIPIEAADKDTIRALKPRIRNLMIVSAVPGLSFMSTGVTTFLGRNITLITTSNGLLSPQNVMLKRICDILAGSLLLLFAAPLFLCIPLAIKLNSRGPAVFRHRRCGYRLKDFSMLKYRTMHVDGDDILDAYLKDHPEAARSLAEKNKIEDDPRITGVGRFLRRLSLDELPQILNVLKGDMSLVGPRPDSRAALQEYMAEYGEIYSAVRPGITGLWQVSGRSEIPYRERVQLDHIYALNWSLWLDLVIILKTFRAVAGRKGAY